MTEAAKSIAAGCRLSPVRVLRVFEKLVLAVSRVSTKKLNLQNNLSQCFLADESSRTSDKNSKSYPQKKRKRQIGEPNIESIAKELQTLANERLSQIIISVGCHYLKIPLKICSVPK